MGAYADLRELMLLEHQATGFSFLPRQAIHSLLAGRHSSRLRGRGLDFEELRRYLPGDDVRSIDWRVTARTRKAHVRVYTEERDRPVWLLVDQRLAMFFGSRRTMKSVVAAECAALAAWRALASGDRVGAMIFTDQGIETIKPSRSRNHVMRILAAITRYNHDLSAGVTRRPDARVLKDVLELARRRVGHDSLVCLVSDMYGADLDVERHITRLSEHNDVLLAFVFDPLEKEMPAVGRVVVGQADRQLEVDTKSSGLRTKVRDDFDARLQRLRELSRIRQIPVLPIDTRAEGVAVQLRDLIGRGRRS